MSNEKELQELLELIEAKELEFKYNKISALFPDTGPYRKELYPKHIAFMNAGAHYQERAFVAANRCLAAGTLVSLSNGKSKKIEDVEIGETVLAYDIKSDALVSSKVVDTFKGYANNMVSFNVGSTKITCTDDHPFLHKNRQCKKQPIKFIQESKFRSQIVVPHRWNLAQNEIKTPEFSKNIARLIGYLIGDGCLMLDCVKFTNTREEYHNDVENIIKELGLQLRRHGSDGFLTVKNGAKGGNPLIHLLKELQLWRKNSHTKNIPEALMTAPLEYVEELLKGLIATDGCIEKNRITYYSCSEELLQDIRALLWRLDIQSYIYMRKIHKGVPQYYLQVRRSDNCKFPIVMEKDNLEITSIPRVSSKYRLARVSNYKKAPDQDIYCITVEHKDHLFIGNGQIMSNTGKTLTGGCEMSYHLTGKYPKGWQGRKFLNAIDAWAAGVSNQSTKEIQQFELLGDINDMGTGLIPKEDIIKITKKPGVAEAVETVYVRHVSGGSSKLTFKSYEQGRISFQGTKKQVIWLDEEPPDPGIYSECLTRLMDKYNPGLIYCTFTPLFGLSDIVLSFIPDGSFPRSGVNPDAPQKFVINVDWSEVPHLDEDQKKSILASYSRHERDARSKGIPSLGSGAIYPYSEDDITCQPFPIPPWWPKAYGMDTGWSKTAAVWGAKNPDTGEIYLYSEHYVSEEKPVIHAASIKSRGEWIVGAADPAGVNLSDGKKIFQLYVEQGLNIVKAEKGDREAGILAVAQMFETGQLKIFNTLTNLLNEIRVYRRDEKGVIIKKKDHAMDAMRYLCTTGLKCMGLEPDENEESSSSMGDDRDEFTGY